VVEEVVTLLRAASEPGDPSSEPEGAARLLVRDPELLASLFQNADLLDPTAPETAGITRIVLEAMEILRHEAE
jgi:hypothetical protein